MQAKGTGSPHTRRHTHNSLLPSMRTRPRVASRLLARGNQGRSEVLGARGRAPHDWPAPRAPLMRHCEPLFVVVVGALSAAPRTPTSRHRLSLHIRHVQSVCGPCPEAHVQSADCQLVEAGATDRSHPPTCHRLSSHGSYAMSLPLSISMTAAAATAQPSPHIRIRIASRIDIISVSSRVEPVHPHTKSVSSRVE